MVVVLAVVWRGGGRGEASELAHISRLSSVAWSESAGLGRAGRLRPLPFSLLSGFLSTGEGKFLIRAIWPCF